VRSWLQGRGKGRLAKPVCAALSNHGLAPAEWRPTLEDMPPETLAELLAALDTGTPSPTNTLPPSLVYLWGCRRTPAPRAANPPLGGHRCQDVCSAESTRAATDVCLSLPSRCDCGVLGGQGRLEVADRSQQRSPLPRWSVGGGDTASRRSSGPRRASMRCWHWGADADDDPYSRPLPWAAAATDCRSPVVAAAAGLADIGGLLFGGGCSQVQRRAGLGGPGRHRRGGQSSGRLAAAP
jgi:hypothetical protein